MVSCILQRIIRLADFVCGGGGYYGCSGAQQHDYEQAAQVCLGVIPDES